MAFQGYFPSSPPHYFIYYHYGWRVVAGEFDFVVGFPHCFHRTRFHSYSYPHDHD